MTYPDPHPPTTPPPPPPPPVPAVDDLFDLAAALGEDVAPQSPARRDPMGARSGLPSAVARTGGPVLPHSEGGRAGVFRVRPGAVSGSFVLPPTPSVPSFDQQPQPGEPYPPPPPPQPWPPPPVWPGMPELAESIRRSVLAERRSPLLDRPIRLGEGPVYDPLIGLSQSS